MFETLKHVGTHFRLPGTIYTYDTITLGNINATDKVTYQNSDKSLKSYLFQKVNTNVFKNPVEIMANIDRVTSYIREKYRTRSRFISTTRKMVIITMCITMGRVRKATSGV